MNSKEGIRRLALLVGVVGAILCGLFSYSQLRSALDQTERHAKFEQLASADVVKKLRASLGKPSIASPDWNVAATEIHEQGIKTIHWTGDYRVGSIETEDGQTLYPTPHPPTWTYLLIGLLPVFGFFVPWGAVRAIEWVGAGYKRSPEADNSSEIPAEIKAQFEGPWKEALERHTNEVRRSFQISTGFYEKLVAVDAASIAIAASVGGMMIAKAATPNPSLSSISHWLVWIILALWLSLICGVAHNFVIVGIAQLEAAYSELDFVRKLMRESLMLATNLYPDLDRSNLAQVLTFAEKKPQAAQRRNVMFAQILQKLSSILGYISMVGFIGAYTLVALCTRWLWL
jgi:uncharacterized membrane protein YciS (DUF1049 family)